jgi:hypothetical protein
MWKRDRMLVFKHQKKNYNLSFIIQWNWMWFVGVQQRWCELFKIEVFGICLVIVLCFFLCGCSCLDDGVKGIKDGNKRQGSWKVKHEDFSSRNCCIVGLAVSESVFFLLVQLRWWEECPHFDFIWNFEHLLVLNFYYTCQEVNKSLEIVESLEAFIWRWWQALKD